LKGECTVVQGIVTSFDIEKGQGFLTHEGGKDIFFRSSAIRKGGLRRLEVGQRVEFELTHGSEGPQAENVRALS
jgi:cold shock protein